MKFINNPFDIVIKAVDELYPNTRAWIQFNPNIKPRKFLWWRFGCCGCTTFPEKGDIQVPIIDISTNIPFEAMLEILAHELAHVVAGVDAKHNKGWEEVFHNINIKYYDILNRKD